MIAGLMKRRIDPLWEHAASPLIGIGMTPNQVTSGGLVLVALSCAAYLYHQSSLAFGLCLAFAFTFDALDGAVARRRHMSTKAGGYFDAMADRYQEFAVFAAIGWVADMWAIAMIAFAGGLLTSYAKARTAIEIPIENQAWPDFFERMERLVFICVLLAADGLATAMGAASPWILAGGFALYALVANATALQRINRAFAMLKRADAKQP
ncbi:CDP-alcohol phosphatidyltransferase family protein [Mesorhizobium sp.]|uniref:CDP-alcohol phosphatidyltransferase family protein n=1 Tax=Mesorhizobium sp. TaxID=1871066 RepID=UPI000FE4F4C0|nr:MAG: CDP-alcohol phosphatidyltransferase family protein [Mesorhizobium sp.]